jgi:hypothetical protein
MVMLAVEPTIECFGWLRIEPHHAVGPAAHREEPLAIQRERIERADVSLATEEAGT